MKILFLGGMFPKEREIEITNKSTGVIQNAANALQWNIIGGLRAEDNIELDLASALFVGSWPRRYKDCFIRGDAEKCSLIPFINLPIYKNISRYIHVFHYLNKWARNNCSNGEKAYVIAYSAHTPFIKALCKVKRKYNIITHLIVPDLPEYMNLESKSRFFRRILKKVDISIQKKFLKGIDNFTFLTKYMSDKYNIYNKPYTIVEGMVNIEESIGDSNLKFEKRRNDEEVRIVYTGTMNIRYGVIDLVNAMKYIKNRNVKLFLCGTGDGVGDICLAAEKDDRIVYCGQVSREEAIKYQDSATILVNPRSGKEEYTKYSFPSKNLEYMLRRKPVIVFKLAGIPEEYDQVLKYFHDNDPKHMADDIEKICSLTAEERKKMGEKITTFALEKKNCVAQTKKILDICLK